MYVDGTGATATELGKGFEKCKKVDDNLNCIECVDTTDRLMYGRCCPGNEVWDFT